METDLPEALSAQMDSLRAARRTFDEARKNLGAERDRIANALREYGSILEDSYGAPPAGLIAELYWDYPEMRISDIVAAFPNTFRGANVVHRMAGRAHKEVTCERCGITYEVTKRIRSQDWAGECICYPEFMAKWQAARDEWWRDRRESRIARLTQAMRQGGRGSLRVETESNERVFVDPYDARDYPDEFTYDEYLEARARLDA